MLELGCFEGNHTVALAGFGAKVIAVDARIENVCKTLVRCGLMGQAVTAFCIDLEHGLARRKQISANIAHHVGVLYHLTDPVGHLSELAGIIDEHIWLDTHIAADHWPLKKYPDAEQYSYFHYREPGRADPFAGTRDHAKWLPLGDLKRLLAQCGFTQCEVIEQREERNGPRVLLFASKSLHTGSGT